MSASLFTDVLPRFLALGFFLAPQPSDGVPIAFGFLQWAVDMTGSLGGIFANAIFHAVNDSPGSPKSALSSLGASASVASTGINNGCSGSGIDAAAMTLCNGLGGVITRLSTSGYGLIEILFIIAICAFLLYFFILLMFRTVALLFVMALAPLCIGLAAWEWKNKFTAAWVQIFVACLIQPIIMGIGISISVVLAASIMPTTTAAVSPSGISNHFQTDLGVLSMGIGLWFTSKIVKQFTSHHLGGHSFKEAVGLATGTVAGIATTLGKTTGTSKKSVSQRGSNGSQQSGQPGGPKLRSAMSRFVDSNIGEGMGGRLASTVAGHSTLAGVSIGAALGAKNAVQGLRGAGGNSVAPAISAAVARDSQQQHHLPHALAKSYSQAIGMPTDDPVAVGNAWRTDPVNKPVVDFVTSLAAQNSYGDSAHPVIKYSAFEGAAFGMQAGINSGLQAHAASQPRTSTTKRPISADMGDRRGDPSPPPAKPTSNPSRLLDN